VDAHWAAVMKKLRLPVSASQSVRDEFFGGDILDRGLIQLMRDLHRKYKIGLISNAWNDLREYITGQGFADAFDTMVISAEVGVVKPDPKIFQIALDQLQVRAKEAMFVDDFKVNIEGCESVGMQGLLFQDPESDIQKLKALL
jgi:putative hydrolase of the HAD superfamily